MKPLRHSLLPAIMASAIALLAASCSTTSRLAPDEVLYTGVKKLEIAPLPPSEPGAKPEKLPSAVAASVKQAVNVKPNNCLISPSVRYPFPLGLWVWNHWKEPGEKGIYRWIYDKLVEEPVLISDVRPDLRTHYIDETLDNNGFFRATSRYDLNRKEGSKKASINYYVDPGPPFIIDSLILLPDTCPLNHAIDSLARRINYLKPGNRFSTDSLSDARINIVNRLRNRGYYFFNPEYIEYLADSTITPERIALKLSLASNIPAWAKRVYRCGAITTRIHRTSGHGDYDTIVTAKGLILQQMPSHLRRRLIPGCIAFRPGRTFSVRQMNQTQTYLSRLGIFNNIEINAVPDTTATEPTLDVYIDCTFDKPLEATLEVNVASSSNSYLGPGLTLGLTNKNIFGGGEQLSVALTGTYEWQTGTSEKHSSVFNSYELSLTGSLAFPRLLAPRWIHRNRRTLNWTRISLNFDLLNRPHYFKMGQFNAGITYEWQYRRHVTNSLTLFKLTYNKLLHTTAEFDSIMADNQAMALSFQSQYVPQMSYTYTYSRTLNARNTLNVQLFAQEAGNIFWTIYEACGQHGQKNLLGTPFSQFIKGQTQIVLGQRLGKRDIWLVERVLTGAAFAYGNSSQVPYSDQFYIGGANSIRAFTVRSLGPGSYRPPRDLASGYFDQTGTFKFEANVELRFPIISLLHGAVFLDTGNIWLLKDDPQRPGGLLRASSFLRDLALGTGVGLRLDISMIVIRADLGYALHAPYNTGHGGYFNMPSFGKSLAFHLAIGYPF